jgi:hypothetical protein
VINDRENLLSPVRGFGPLSGFGTEKPKAPGPLPVAAQKRPGRESPGRLPDDRAGRRESSDFPPSRPHAGLMTKRAMVYRACLERDGVEWTSVVEHRCTNQLTGGHFTAHVCARFIEEGRETRVTCRTFIPGAT